MLVIDVQNVRSHWQWMVSTQRMVPTTVLMTIIDCLSVGVACVVNWPRVMLSQCSVIPTTSSAFIAPSVGEWLAVCCLLLVSDYKHVRFCPSSVGIVWSLRSFRCFYVVG